MRTRGGNETHVDGDQVDLGVTVLSGLGGGHLFSPIHPSYHITSVRNQFQASMSLSNKIDMGAVSMSFRHAFELFVVCVLVVVVGVCVVMVVYSQFGIGNFVITRFSPRQSVSSQVDIEADEIQIKFPSEFHRVFRFRLPVPIRSRRDRNRGE
jgi:hypothetical protein